jgi:hypothetical protein
MYVGPFDEWAETGREPLASKPDDLLAQETMLPGELPGGCAVDGVEQRQVEFLAHGPPAPRVSVPVVPVAAPDQGLGRGRLSSGRSRSTRLRPDDCPDGIDAYDMTQPDDAAAAQAGVAWIYPPVLGSALAAVPPPWWRSNPW